MGQHHLHTEGGEAPLSFVEISAVVAVSGLPPQIARNLTSSLVTFAKVVGLPMSAIPATMAELRELEASAAPGAMSLSATRWRNVKSEVKRALRLAGVAPDAIKTPLDDRWESVAAALPTASERSAMRRFARFCMGVAIKVSDVDDAAVSAYHDYLDASQFKTPKRTTKDIIRLWNRVSVDQPSPGLATLSMQRATDHYSLPWSELPAELAAAAHDFYRRSLNPDYLDDESLRAVRPSTADKRDRMLRALASIEIKVGVPPESLRSLADVVRPTNLQPALQFLLNRNGGEPNRHYFELAFLALTVARHWAKLPEPDIKKLKMWAAKARPQRTGMTAKNRERLRQFSSPEVLRNFIAMPQRVFDEIANRAPSAATAWQARHALMLAILSLAPMRLKNLRSLDRKQHFRQVGSVKENRWHLVLRAEEVKNALDLEYPIPPHLMAMIDRYMTTYQPILARRSGSTALFPGRSADTTLTESGARNSLVQFVAKCLGLKMNPHLFRHLAARVFLDAKPGEYETVRRFLGHKNIQTTIEFYADFVETAAAMRRYASVLGESKAMPTGEPMLQAVG